MLPCAWGEAAHRKSVILIMPDPPGRPISTSVLDAFQHSILMADPTIAVSADYVSQKSQVRPGFAEAQHDWFRRKYTGSHFDVLVVFGLQPLDAVMEMRDDVWPNVPIVMTGVSPASYRALGHQPLMTASLIATKLGENLKLAVKLLPETRHIALVGGASPADVSYNTVARQMIRESVPGLDLIDMTGGIPLDELRKRVAVLPPHTIILIYAYLYDSAGRPMFVHDVVAALSPVDRAPIFNFEDYGLGDGIVGGKLTHYSIIGQSAANLTLRILKGERPASIPPLNPETGSFQFDWRQLQRWNIPLDRLPPGSEILYRPFSVWEQYRWWIVAILAAGITESLLIAVLLYQRRRAKETEKARKRAELEAIRTREEIAHLNRVASLGELGASLAHELNQPLAGILANAQAASRFLAQHPPDLDEVGAALEDIRADDTRAGEIIRKMREMVRKGHSQSVLLELNVLAQDVMGLLRTDAQIRGIALSLELSPENPVIQADPIQLQQVVMNLVRNGMEAISSASQPGEVRLVIIRTEIDPDGSAGISVADSGPGVPREVFQRVFEPFFSTKDDGLGMGLSISRSIVESHGGRIFMGNSSGGNGAVFHVRFPLVRERMAAA